MSHILRPEIGDVVAVEGRTAFSRAIQLVSGSLISHVGLIVSEDPLLVMEALSRVVTRPYDEALEDCKHAWLLKPINVSREARRLIVRESCKYSGASYGYLKIALHLLDFLTGKEWITQLLARSRKPICSWHVAQAYKAAGLDFGEIARGVTPAEIYQFALDNDEKYAVYKVK